VHSKGQDHSGLGRWSYITLQGKQDFKLTIITAYRVSQKSSASVGGKTAYMQQFRALQSIQNQTGSPGRTIEPNRQFILDLQAWIQFLQSQGHHIILNLDNNDDLYDSEGFITCFGYPALGSTISFHIYPWQETVGLHVDLFLQDTVECSGILPYYCVFPGDYHACFLDLNTDLPFSGTTSPLAPPCQRRLQLFDPRKVSKYREALHEQLQYHAVFDKCQALMEAASTKQWEVTHTEDYKKLDAVITQAMLHAESVCSKKYTKRFDWSPTLIQSVETVRFWRLLLK